MIKSGTNNALLGGGDLETNREPELTELKKIKKEKDALETELKAIRKLLDEKSINQEKAQKTDLDGLVSNNLLSSSDPPALRPLPITYFLTLST